jgi:hypothetical protein
MLPQPLLRKVHPADDSVPTLQLGDSGPAAAKYSNPSLSQRVIDHMSE